jgi:hypothetical protein
MKYDYIKKDDKIYVNLDSLYNDLNSDLAKSLLDILDFNGNGKLINKIFLEYIQDVKKVITRNENE